LIFLHSVHFCSLYIPFPQFWFISTQKKCFFFQNFFLSKGDWEAWMSRPKFRTSMTEFLLQPFFFEKVKIKYTSTPLNAGWYLESVKDGWRLYNLNACICQESIETGKVLIIWNISIFYWVWVLNLLVNGCS